jgi:hypothetical protein
MHWLTMRLERVIPATELFANFRKGVLSGSPDAEALIRELCRDAEVMRSFDSVDVNTPEGKFFARFGPLDAATVLPVVLLLFRSPEVSVERRRRALRILESWLARRVLMRLTAKNYNRQVPQLVAKIKADLPHADEALLAALRGGTGAVSWWPEDVEFTDFLRNRDIYGTVSKPRLAMALAAVEASLRSDKTEAALVEGDLSIEHLMPQAWDENWPLAPAEAGMSEEELKQAVDARNAHLHRLGNLTIVASPLNPAMSNAEWRTKREKLNEHSVLLLNSKLAAPETWDEQAIDERGAWLATRLAAIWPGPNSQKWE